MLGWAANRDTFAVGIVEAGRVHVTQRTMSEHCTESLDINETIC